MGVKSVFLTLQHEGNIVSACLQEKSDGVQDK